MILKKILFSIRHDKVAYLQDSFARLKKDKNINANIPEETLQIILEEIPEEYRRPLGLYYKGCSYKEITIQTQMSVKETKRYISHGKKEIRDRIKML